MSEDNEKSAEIIDDRSSLEKLNSGLLMAYFKREIEDSAYSVIGRITFGHLVEQKRHSYVGELTRVLDELEITANLLKDIDATTTKDINGKLKQPEDLISYYTGIFFDLVHQAKDKLLRLLDYMAADERTKTEYKEADKVRFNKHEEVMKEIGIADLIEEWKQDSGPIGVILKKRTQHHHFTSNVQLNGDLQKLKMTRTMLSPQASSQLNEAGKKYMEDLGKESFEKYRNDIVDKQEHALGIIRDNLDAIAEKLIAHYHMANDYKTQAEFTTEYMDYLGSLHINNEASIDKVAENALISVKDILAIPSDIKDEVISVYGAGSYFRNEFYEGSSDINLYVITKNTTRIFDTELPVTLYVLSEEDFLSDTHKRDQFICWSDGVLLQGKEYEWNAKDFPKPGTLLSMLLNRGIVEELEDIQSRISSLAEPTPLELRLVELHATKKMLDYLFGIAMSNKPFYTASRSKRIEYIKEVFDVNALTLTLERVYFGLIAEKDSFCQMMDAFLKIARENYAKQESIESKINGPKEIRD
jgi:hypothetical protein